MDDVKSKLNDMFTSITTGGVTLDKKVIIIGACVCILAGCLLTWYLLGSPNGGLPNNGGGADAVRSDISTAQQQQQSAIDTIGTVQNGLDRSTATVGTISTGLSSTANTIATVEKRFDDSEVELNNSADLIRQGQCILAAVRSRGKSGTDQAQN